MTGTARPNAIHVVPAIDDPTRGTIRWSEGHAACRLGREGVVAAGRKREGDGATPLGRWPLRRVFYRADRLAAPATDLPVSALEPAWAWCDAPSDPAYNRLLAEPPAASHERLWRDDGKYDLIVVLGYNDDPPMPGRGSAIFLHLSETPPGPTAGCVAVTQAVLLSILRTVPAGGVLTVAQPA